MEDKKVSIIMPAYNASEFLARSISSVQNQTYKNWELLIVDDGSTDNSREIIQAFCSEDSRIKLLCNSHGGTARARNTAIEKAEGDYLTFLDSDDLYHPQYLVFLLETAVQENADLVICGITRGTDYAPFLKSEVDTKCSVITTDQAFAKMYGGQWPLIISPWNKLYAKRLFETTRFPDGRFFEDAATVNLAMYASNRVCILESPLYFYYITPNSSSKTKRSAELLDREWALRSHWEFFLREGRKDLAYLALPFYLVELISIYHRIEASDKPEDCRIIRAIFEKTYKAYRHKVTFTETQKDQILAFRYPHIYDIRSMVRNDGIIGTLSGFVKRKLMNHE